MLDRIRGQVCVVTGATGGIGGAIARVLAEAGADLMLTGRDETRLAGLAQSLTATGAQVQTMACDLTREADAQAMMEAAMSAFGRVDTLLNVPGLSVPGAIAQTLLADYERMIDVNLKSAFLCTKHFLQRVDAEAGGLIVNVSSVAGKTANPNAPLYCTAKAALNMFSAGTALQARAQNVRVTSLCPGATTTSGFWGDRPVPHEKFLQPEEVARMAAWIVALPPAMVVHEVVFEPFAMFRGK